MIRPDAEEILSILEEEFNKDDLTSLILMALLEDFEYVDMNKKIIDRFIKRIEDIEKEYDYNYIDDLVMIIMEKSSDYYEGREEKVIDKVRVFNLPKKIECPDCGEDYSVKWMVQQGLYFHFNYLDENELCESCEIGVPELHYFEFKCYSCLLTWLFELKNNNKFDERKTWFVKLNSWSSMDMTTKYDGDLNIREFTCKVDLSNNPSGPTVTAMITEGSITDDVPFECREGSITDDVPFECSDDMHFYIADILRDNMFYTDVYCPGCDSFNSEDIINRRSKKYQSSKNKCFHEIIPFIEKNIGINCTRCNNY